MTGGPGADAGEDPRVATLLRVNAELAAELRGLQAGRVEGARSAAAPSARRLGRLLADNEASIAERDERLERLEAELARLRVELADQGERLRGETLRAAELEEERVRLVGKVGEYGELAEALQAEVGRLRGGVGGWLRRAAARASAALRRR